MKKILVSFLVITSLIFTFQVITVHANLLFDTTKLDKIIHNIESMFIAGEEEVTELLWDQQENRRTYIEELLVGSYEEASTMTSINIERYKEIYLSNVEETAEEAQLGEPFEKFESRMGNELEVEIEIEIVDYIGQLLDQKSNHSHSFILE